MTMQTDVKAAYVTSSGANAYAGPARVKAVTVCTTGACVVELTDGGSSGTSRLKFDVPASATENPFYMLLPGEGIQFTTSIWVKSLTNATSATFIYG
jgi:hypothetical protein